MCEKNENSKDLIDCCLDTARPSVEFCYEYNKNKFLDAGYKKNNRKSYIQNLYSCDEILNDYQNSCFSIPSEGINKTRECIQKNGCEIFPFSNPECMEKKRTDILACVSQECGTMNSPDCKNYPIFFDWIKNNTKTNKSFSNYIYGHDSHSLFPIRDKYWKLIPELSDTLSHTRNHSDSFVFGMFLLGFGLILSILFIILFRNFSSKHMSR